MNFDKATLPINWFDLLVVVVLIVGMQRGRKHGMSEELLGMFKWLAIVFGCAAAYMPLGTKIANSSVFSLLSAYLMAYVGSAMVIAALFAALKKLLGGKLLSSDAVGKSEFYLGMVAGMVRFSCMLIAALSLLGARAYTTTEIRADVKYMNDLYGSTFFPKLYSLQQQVFEKSLLGPWIKNNLTFFLIQPTPPEKKEIRHKETELP